MKTYTVFWFYYGNHGGYIRDAESLEDACRGVVIGFSEDFAKHAELVAVEGEHYVRPAKAYDHRVEVLATRGSLFTLSNETKGKVVSRRVTSADRVFTGVVDGDTRRIKVEAVAEFLPSDCSEHDVNDRVFIPAGTDITAGSRDQPTKCDTWATVTKVYDDLIQCDVDNIAALPDIQREWNESEGLKSRNIEVYGNLVSPCGTHSS